jgi:hypothetical protein
MLKGTKVFFEPDAFPCTDVFRDVTEQMHIVIPREQLSPGFRTLDDFVKDDAVAEATKRLLCFFADAFTNVLKYRGTAFGKHFVGNRPRAVILLTYATKRLFSNEQEQVLLPREALFEEDNLAALVYSILIMDEVKLGDAVGDQLAINARGPPHVRRKKDEPPEPEAVPENAQRRDIEGASLGATGTKYYYPETRAPGTKENIHSGMIQTTEAFYAVVDAVTGSPKQLHRFERRSNQHFGAFVSDFPYHPASAFSLHSALQRLEMLGAHPKFCSHANWINEVDGPLGFGAVRWLNAEVLDYASGMHARPATRVGYASTSADINIKNFNGKRLLRDCLPHCQIGDAQMLKPIKRTDGKVLAFPSRGLDGQLRDAQIPVADLLEAYGIRTHYAEETLRENGRKGVDIFNDYFARYVQLNTRIAQMIGNPLQPSGRYIHQLQAFREQGFAVLKQFLSPSNPNLPVAYVGLLRSISERQSWRPRAIHPWQAFSPTSLSQYAQSKVAQLAGLESLVDIADSMLSLFPLIMRSVVSTYLPRVGSRLNKIHIQIICSPGTSKSNTLVLLASFFLLPKTFEVMGSASGLGVTGEMASTRQIELYHELPTAMAPNGDLKNDDDRAHKMLLTMLGDGYKRYTTTARRVADNGVEYYQTGKVESVEAEYTSSVIGARNVQPFTGNPAGSAAAMPDRFANRVVPQIKDSTRVALVQKVLQISQGADSSLPKIRYRDQAHLRQRIYMEYGAAIACYAVPLPNISLFSDLGPEALNFLAVRRPAISNRLRRMTQMITEMLAETLVDAVDKAVESVLNPTASIKETARTKTKFVQHGEYNMQEILTEVSRYAYLRMDTLAHVFSGTIWELIDGNCPIILQLLAESKANYFSLGRGRAEQETTYQHAVWARTQSQNDAEIAKLRQTNGTLETFLGSLGESYGLLVPATNMQEDFKRRSGASVGNPSEVGNEEFNLVAENIKPENRASFNCGVKRVSQPIRLARDPANYKLETRNNKSSYNPNYLTLSGTISSLAKLMADSNLGVFALSADGLQEILRKLKFAYLVTPFFPLVAKDSSTCVLSLLQGLRYSPEIMASFPHYKVPIVIEDFRRNETHILISYLEMDPYQTVRDVIAHISYHATRPVNTVMDVFNQERLYYEPLRVAPIANKKLLISGTANANPIAAKMLHAYLMDEEDDAEVELDAGTAFAIALDARHETRTYLYEDIELEHAMDYLRRNFPNDPEEKRRLYYPASIEQRLHGIQGFYPNQFPEFPLDKSAYPEVLKTVCQSEPLPRALVGELLPPSSESYNRLMSDIIDLNASKTVMEYDDLLTENPFQPPEEKRSAVRFNIGALKISPKIHLPLEEKVVF